MLLMKKKNISRANKKTSCQKREKSQGPRLTQLYRDTIYEKIRQRRDLFLFLGFFEKKLLAQLISPAVERVSGRVALNPHEITLVHNGITGHQCRFLLNSWTNYCNSTTPKERQGVRVPI